jgi:predicted CopG family antitoxin
MENIMRTLKVSDDLYEQLKCLVVDPFDDTPEIVIARLIEIVNKAKSRWCPFEEEAEASESSGRRHREFSEEEPVVVL